MARTTLNSFSSSGGDFGGVDYISKSANYTAAAGEGIIADTSSATWTLTLPASPSTGDRVAIIDPADWSENNLIVARNGSSIEGLTQNLTCNLRGAKATLIYVGGTTGWNITCQPGPTGVPESLRVLNFQYAVLEYTTLTSVGFTSNHQGNNAATVQNNDNHDVSIDVENVRDVWPTSYPTTAVAPTAGGIVEILYNTDNHRFYGAFWEDGTATSNVVHSSTNLDATMDVIFLRDGWGDTNGFPYAGNAVNLWYSGAPAGQSNAPSSYLSFPFWGNSTANLTTAGVHAANPSSTISGADYVPAGLRPVICESFLRYNPNDAKRIIRKFAEEGYGRTVAGDSSTEYRAFVDIYKGTVAPDYSKLNSSSNIDTSTYTLPGA